MVPSVPGGTARSSSPVSPRESTAHQRSPLRACLVRQRFSHVTCARLTGFRLRERAPLCIGEVRRLAEYQELVEGVYTEPMDQFQTHREPHPAEVIHCLFEA